MKSLKETIAQKRKQMEEKKQQFNTKYITNAQLKQMEIEKEKEREKEREKEKEKEKEKKEEEEKREEEEEEEKREGETRTTTRTRTIKNEINEKKVEEEKESKLPRNEVIKRLRALSQPIILFAETDFDREKRLRVLESRAEIGLQEGQRNDWNALLKQIQQSDIDHEQQQVSAEISDQIQPTSLKRSKKEPPLQLKHRIPHCPEDEIHFYLYNLLDEWEIYVNEQFDSKKRTPQAREAIGRVKQTKNYITPLFDLLEKRNLEPVIVSRVHEIVLNMKKREYVHANDIYLRLAIGNAPWPIGVTMVGIHERSAREKIFTNHVAHILNDERQRKYIQSIKRLITCAQTLYPTDPSKSVLN
eukprot:TRINITY_DN247_c0_g1_i1.p1 TRINITY_DN247_c0_g1~~TRINITY_DN247_c0_g1_i1.p1  ORF type:complete len:359 (+),score=133.04 TRINITY_DN247_c0_g1_i1:161-1237(+)